MFSQLLLIVVTVLIGAAQGFDTCQRYRGGVQLGPVSATSSRPHVLTSSRPHTHIPHHSVFRAINITEWAFSQASANPAAEGLLGQAGQRWAAAQPVTTDQIQYMPQLPWVAFQVEGVLGATDAPGEVFRVLNDLNATDKLGGNLTEMFPPNNFTLAYGLWLDGWTSMADALRERASEMDSSALDALKSDTLSRAAQYDFVGQWAYPVSDEALEAQKNGFESWFEAMKLKEKTVGWSVTKVSIPFSNGTTTVELPGVFVTPDPTKRLPLILMNSGTDYPMEAMWPVSGPQFMDAGYSALVFDGPGQGSVKRSDPWMPLVPRWDGVIDTVIDSLESNDEISPYYSPDDVFLFGASLGGYLSGQACSMIEKGRLAGCILTPATTSMVDVYNDRFASTSFVPLSGLPASDLPSGYGDALKDTSSVIEQIIQPLVVDCNGSAEARAVWNDFFSGQLSPVGFTTIVYAVIDYLGGGAGFTNSTPEAILEASYDAWGNFFAFVNQNVSNTKTPVLVLSGDEDVVMGGQQMDYWDQLPQDIKRESKLVNFTGASGAALHSQIGAIPVQAEVTIPWIQEKLSDTAGTPVNGVARLALAGVGAAVLLATTV